MPEFFPFVGARLMIPASFKNKVRNRKLVIKKELYKNININSECIFKFSENMKHSLRRILKAE